MDYYKMEKFKEMLLIEKEKINKALETTKDNPESDELSTNDNHPADIGTELFMREQDEGFKVSYNKALEEIESSLANIESGSYGLCSSCGKEISEERLEAIPYVSMCTDCMNQDSKIEDEDESLDKDNVHFDRGVSYQDLAKHENIPKDPSNSTGDYMGLHDEDNETNTDDLDNISQEDYDKTQE